MKILYFSSSHYLDHALPQVKALSRLADVYFVVEVAPESWSTGIFDVPAKKVPSGLYDADEVLGKHFPDALRRYWKDCKRFNLFVFDHGRSIHFRTWMQAKALGRLLGTINPDIVHFDGVSLRTIPTLWALRNRPLVMTVHDPEPHSGEHNWRRRCSDFLAFRLTDQLVVHSEYSKNLLEKKLGIGSRLIEAIPLGMLDPFSAWTGPHAAKKGTRVLFFGRLSPYKGLEDFYSAAMIMSRTVAGCRFEVAGRPIAGYALPPKPPLENGCSLNVQDHYLSNLELAELFRSATVVVCPYRDATQSGVVLTAYAFGIPVVVTDVGGLHEYVWQDETGIIVPAGNPESIAMAAISIVNDPAKQSRMRDGIQGKRSEELNWDRIAAKMVEMYSGLLTRTKERG